MMIKKQAKLGRVTVHLRYSAQLLQITLNYA